MKKKLNGLLMTSFVVGSLLSMNAFAKLKAVGPKSAVHGFPEWYQDMKGLKLGLCIGDPHCLPLEGVDPNAPVEFPNNFPGEAFWWNAETELPVAGGGRVLVVMALEAAFANEEPAEGDRVSFARLRIRGFNLPRGTYTITHPYGTKTFRVTEVTRRNINFTSDVGLAPEDFAGCLKTTMGPFLKWDPKIGAKAPAGFVGDPNVPHRVTGSPTGNNFVRVSRGGKQVGLTRLFNVAGKIQPATPPYAPVE